MRRILFACTAAVSALLFVATLIIHTGYRNAHLAVEFPGLGGRWELATDSGRLWLDNAPQVDEERFARDRAKQLKNFAADKVSRAGDVLRASGKDSFTLELHDPAAMAMRRRLSPEEAGFLNAETSYLRSEATYLSAAACVQPMASYSVPLQVPALSMALLPACWIADDLRRSRKARRADRGLCPVCAYDLRASPYRCPECGTPRTASLKESAERVPEPSS